MIHATLDHLCCYTEHSLNAVPRQLSQHALCSTQPPQTYNYRNCLLQVVTVASIAPITKLVLLMATVRTKPVRCITDASIYVDYTSFAELGQAALLGSSGHLGSAATCSFACLRLVQ